MAVNPNLPRLGAILVPQFPQLPLFPVSPKHLHLHLQWKETPASLWLLGLKDTSRKPPQMLTVLDDLLCDLAYRSVTF